MKKFYSIMASAIIGAFSFTANAQNEYKILQDLTSTLQNPTFAADDAVEGLIRTYAKDLQDEGKGAGGTEMYGHQPVTGWIAARPTDNIKNDPSLVGGDASAAGIFTYLTEEEEGTTPSAKLGGEYFAPYDYDCPTITGNKCLGMAAVWGGLVQYSQEVTLPAGAYMIIVPVANTAGTNVISKNMNGFITADGVEYLCSKVRYDVGAQQNDTIAFKLKAQTTGYISVGYKAENTGSASTPHLFYDGVQLYEIDPSELDIKEIAEAKEQLLLVIQEGEELGVDTKAAYAVYNNPNATLAEVLAAIESQKEINKNGVVDLSEFFINNPHFNIDAAIPEGNGICTYTYDMPKNESSYFGMQPLTGWVSSNPSTNEYADQATVDANKGYWDTVNGRACGVFEIGKQAFLGGPDFKSPMEMSDGSTEGKVLGFISVWSSTTQYTQAVTIPAGKYTLTISYYNVGGTGTVAKNLMGFVTDEGVEYLADLKTFKVGSWEKFKVVFELDEPTSGYFTLGMKAANAGSGSMPHFFIDGITLNYVGDASFDPSLLALQAAVSSATKQIDNKMYTDLKEELTARINRGSELISSQSSDVEVNKAATDAINTLLPDVYLNVEAYKKLQVFRDVTLDEAITKYESIESLRDRLYDLSDEVDNALEECCWTTEDIEKTTTSLDGIIREEMQKVWDEAIASGETLDEPLDVTMLIDGLSYTYSTTPYAASSVPDKQWEFGDATNFKTHYGTAEVWNQSPFEISNTLKNMPAGTYTIKTRAFYRTVDNQTNYDNYVGGEKTPLAFIFAGLSKSPLTNVAEIATTDESAFTSPAQLSNGMYLPNNQQTAHDLFVNEEYDEKLVSSVTTVLAADGDLKFGIQGDQMESNSWVVWYSFEVSWNAIDEDVLTDELTKLIEQGATIAEEVIYNAQAVSQLTEACDKASDALGGDKDSKIEATLQLNGAISYAKEGMTIYENMNNIASRFYTMLEETPIVSSDMTIIEILDAISEEDFESNEQMQGYTDAIPTAWTKYVLGQDLKAATEDEPVDITPAIINAAFEWENADYWTITPEEEDAAIGQNEGYQNNATYTNTEEGITIEKFVEAWRANGVVLNNGVIGQEIKAVLPEGYYELAADAFALNQNAVPEEGTQGVYLMAQSAGAGIYEESICVDQKESAEAPRHIAVQFYSDGKTLTTVGIHVNNTNASWAVADNFTLKCLGTTPPTAIEKNDATPAEVSEIFTISGIKTNTTTKGINIVKMSNGSVVKVVK